jgi:hypothetical protein
MISTEGEIDGEDESEEDDTDDGEPKTQTDLKMRKEEPHADGREGIEDGGKHGDDAGSQPSPVATVE